MTKSEKLRAANALEQMTGGAPAPRDVLPYAAPPLAGYYQQPPQVIYQQIVTVQQTSKGWKALTAIGAIILLAGICFVFVTLNSKDTEAIAWGVGGGLTVAGGLALTIIAKIGAWWCHG